MKTRLLLFALIASAVVLAITSCGRVVANTQIDAFEKSIKTLEDTYKKLKPSEIQTAVEVCEKQLELIEGSDFEYTLEQQERISKLKGRFHAVLVKIEAYLIFHREFAIVDYIKGLIKELFGE